LFLGKEFPGKRGEEGFLDVLARAAEIAIFWGGA